MNSVEVNVANGVAEFQSPLIGSYSVNISVHRDGTPKGPLSFNPL